VGYPVSSRPRLHPSIPQARRAMSGISLDGSCLKISAIINPQPGPSARHPGQGRTVIATISIAYLVFPSPSQCLAHGRVQSVLTAQTDLHIQSPVVCVRKCGFGGWGKGTLFSLISKQYPHMLHVNRACAVRAPGQPRTIVGSRSSGAPGRPGPGTGDSSQKSLLRPKR